MSTSLNDPAIDTPAKERRDLKDGDDGVNRTRDSSIRSGLSSGGTNALDLALGSVGGVANSALDPSRLIAIRNAEQEKEKRQLDGLTGPLGGVVGGIFPPSNPISSAVEDLLGELTGEIPAVSNLLSLVV